MNGRSSGRLLAPLALALTAIAFVAVIASGGGEESGDSAGPPAITATPTATRTPTPEPTSTPASYTVQPGDTPSSIADAEDVDLDALLEANPDIDPGGLRVGQVLDLP